MISIDKNDQTQRGLARFILAQSSFGIARRAAQYVAEKITSDSDPLFMPLEAATVICYTRPFSGGGGQIPKRYHQIADDVALQALHTSLCKHRDEFIAHSDEALHRVGFFEPGTHIHAGALKGEVTRGEEVGFTALALRAFPTIVRLCDYQLERLRIDIEEGKEKLRTPPASSIKRFP